MSLSMLGTARDATNADVVVTFEAPTTPSMKVSKARLTSPDERVRSKRLIPITVTPCRSSNSTADPTTSRGGVELGELGFEVHAAEVLIAYQDQHLPGLTLTAGGELQAHQLLIDLRRGQRQRPGGDLEREDGVQPKAPEWQLRLAQ